jgi:hypothetical protein
MSRLCGVGLALRDRGEILEVEGVLEGSPAQLCGSELRSLICTVCCCAPAHPLSNPSKSTYDHVPSTCRLLACLLDWCSSLLAYHCAGMLPFLLPAQS